MGGLWLVQTGWQRKAGLKAIILWQEDTAPLPVLGTTSSPGNRPMRKMETDVFTGPVVIGQEIMVLN